MAKKTKQKSAQELAFATMADARKEAVRKGDVEGLLNISITYFEFSVKMAENEEHDAKKNKNKLGFHHERVRHDRDSDHDGQD